MEDDTIKNIVSIISISCVLYLFYISGVQGIYTYRNYLKKWNRHLAPTNIEEIKQRVKDGLYLNSLLNKKLRNEDPTLFRYQKIQFFSTAFYSNDEPNWRTFVLLRNP